MKASLALVLFGLAAVLAKDLGHANTTAYGYHGRFGIARLQEIKKAEEELAKDPSRIIGGAAAVAGQFPHQAGLIIDLIGVSGNSVCGAVVLANNRLITAAHCWYDGVYQAWQFTVILGTPLLFSGGTRIQTSDVVMHESWSPILTRDDLAIIRLSTPVTFSTTIASIPLPSESDVTDTFVGRTAVISGFGRTSDNAGISTAQFLSWAEASVISNTVCRLYYPFNVRDTIICISTTAGTSTCGGDSGGPLTIDGKLMGVTSFGSSMGCEVGWPAAFSRITEYLEWISGHL